MINIAEIIGYDGVFLCVALMVGMHSNFYHKHMIFPTDSGGFFVDKEFYLKETNTSLFVESRMYREFIFLKANKLESKMIF